MIHKRPPSLRLNFLRSIFPGPAHRICGPEKAKPEFEADMGKNIPHGTYFEDMKGSWREHEACQERGQERTQSESSASVAVETPEQKGSWRQAAVLNHRRNIGESVASVALEISEY